MLIHPVLKDVMIKEWGNDGLICSDGGALGLLITSHKSFADKEHGVAAAVKAGEGGHQQFPRHLHRRLASGIEGWALDRGGRGRFAA
jgi:hypothetical protein